MNRVLKAFLIMILQIVSILVVAGLAFYKAVSNSYAEDNSRFSSSYSIDEAIKRGVLIRPVHSQPQCFMWEGERICIAEAWIERGQQIHYSWLFFSDVEYLDEYHLVIRPDRLTDSVVGSELLESNDQFFGTISSGIGNPYVYRLNMEKNFSMPMNIYVVDGIHHDTVLDTLVVN